jgi:hypothetical protein
MPAEYRFQNRQAVSMEKGSTPTTIYILSKLHKTKKNPLLISVMPFFILALSLTQSLATSFARFHEEGKANLWMGRSSHGEIDAEGRNWNIVSRMPCMHGLCQKHPSGMTGWGNHEAEP